jgi:hypothetical protein
MSGAAAATLSVQLNPSDAARWRYTGSCFSWIESSGSRMTSLSLSQGGLDLGAPAAERPEHRLGHPHELRDAIAHRQPLEPERPCQLGAQDALVVGVLILLSAPRSMSCLRHVGCEGLGLVVLFC